VPKQGSVSSSSEDLRALPRKDICHLLQVAEHEVLMLQRRIRTFKDILRQKEHADARQKDSYIIKKDSSIKELRMLLKERDATIRRMQLRTEL